MSSVIFKAENILNLWVDGNFILILSLFKIFRLLVPFTQVFKTENDLLCTKQEFFNNHEIIKFRDFWCFIKNDNVEFYNQTNKAELGIALFSNIKVKPPEYFTDLWCSHDTMGPDSWAYS